MQALRRERLGVSAGALTRGAEYDPRISPYLANYSFQWVWRLVGTEPTQTLKTGILEFGRSGPTRLPGRLQPGIPDPTPMVLAPQAAAAPATVLYA